MAKILNMEKILIFLALFGYTEAAVTWDSQCGVTKGCFPNCKDTGCTYLVTWQVPSGQDSVTFEIFMEQTGSIWVGVAFSSDESMGDDSGVACLTTTSSILSYYNTGLTSSLLASPSVGISATSVSQANGITSCSFTRNNAANADSKYFDLNTDYYLFLGAGPASSNAMSEHSSIPYISVKVVDFQSTDIVGVGGLSSLIKLHAISMVLAWHLFSCVAIVIARYQRKMLNEKEVLGAKIWFQLHRLLMIVVAVFVLIGFIAIFVEVGELEVEEEHAAHPVMGIIIFCFTMINPIMALFRPSPDHKQRFIFNWAHRIVGMIAHIFAIVVIFLGFDFDRVENVSDAAEHASYAHIAIHATIMLILEIIKWWTHFKDDEEKPNTTVELVNQILMLIHALAMFATTLAVIIIIGET